MKSEKKRRVACNPSGIQTVIVDSLQRLHIVSEGRRHNVRSSKDMKSSKDASRANLWFLSLVCCWPSSVHIVPLCHATYCSHQNQQQHVDFPNSLSWNVALTNTASQSVCFITETMPVLTVWIWVIINISLTFWHHVTIIHDYQASMLLVFSCPLCMHSNLSLAFSWSQSRPE